MAKTIALLGLGIIGSRAANCLTKAGHQVNTWNRTPQERKDFHKNVESAINGADFITLYLKDGNAVRETFNKIRHSLTAKQVVLNHSTIDLDTTRWLHTQCQEIGCKFLDAPFTGSKVAASEKSLVYYVGGDKNTLEISRVVLEATSKEIKHLGPVGSATVVKLATNLISASTVQALSEALAIVRAYKIEPEVFIDSVTFNACGSPLAQMKLPTMVTADYDTHFSLSNMLKDSRFALQLAKDKGLKLPGTETTATCMESQCQKGDALLDFSALFKAYD